MVCTLFRQSAHGFLDRSCDAEVAELKVAEVGNENVLRLDVSVNDIVFAADLKCLADVDAELYDVAA